MSEFETTRRRRRKTVKLDAQCQLGETGFVLGEIRDLHEDGAFFEPDGGILDGWFREASGQVEARDKVMLRIKTDRRRPTQRLPATVRWLGESQRHDAWGFGLELDEPLQLDDGPEEEVG